MFSPATKRFGIVKRREHDAAGQTLGSPNPSQSFSSIDNRPSTGTPAPWAPRLSTLARIPSSNQPENLYQDGSSKPVYLSEFPQVVRDEQTKYFRTCSPGNAYTSGGLDQETGLAWLIFGGKAFIWSYLPSLVSSKQSFVVLDLPNWSSNEEVTSSWIACFVNWDCHKKDNNVKTTAHSSVGVLLCNKRTRDVVYCPDIYSGITLVSSSISPDDGRATSGMKRKNIDRIKPIAIISAIAFSMDNSNNSCFSVACLSNGELWQLRCDIDKIQATKVFNNLVSSSSQTSDQNGFFKNQNYPRSLVRRFRVSSDVTSTEFFLLTGSAIMCFTAQFLPRICIEKRWLYEFSGNETGLDCNSAEFMIPIDMQIDAKGDMLTILVATHNNEKPGTSSCAKFSLLRLRYKSNLGFQNSSGKVLEKSMPAQDIISKAQIDDQESFFSMNLRIGGKPSGSAVIVASDGTATVSFYNESSYLYHFDLPYGASKVLDAAALSENNGEGGAWVVLTEKAGVWAIPEEALLIGGVESSEIKFPQKKSPRKDSIMTKESTPLFGIKATSKGSSERLSFGDGVFDEESEILLGQLFQNFCSTGHVESCFQKLQNAGSFEKDGELNVFTRMSKSIVDTFAKHWTTTRVEEVMSIAIVSSQLYEKKQKHEQFLQFIASSKCHEELCSKQRRAILTIMEHGEKLHSMIQLRETQSLISESQNSGVFWDIIQFIGEIFRRKNTLLLDRDNAEIFYTKVSNLEQVFDCVEKHFKHLIHEGQPFEDQVRRACDISKVLIAVLRATMQYKNENHMWYPPMEALTPWYCQSVVRNGFWKVGSFMRVSMGEASGISDSLRSTLYTCLELITEVSLETYTGAITAKLERGEDIKGLREDYWHRRDSLLASLYEQIRYFVERRHQIFSVPEEETPEETFRKLSSKLLSISRRYEAYDTMWKIVSDLNDLDLLRTLMRESMGPRGGFSYYVFEQFYEKKQFSKLLRLGEEFHKELSIFLGDHKDLLWLHQIFLHQFPSASQSLHSLALSQSEGNTLTLSSRKRFLNLAKIALMAGKDSKDNIEVLNQIKADTKMLKLQEAITEIIGDSVVDDGCSLLHPEDLVTLCVKNESRDLALWAFDVLAWTSSSFRRKHRSLLETCWINAAEKDDWLRLFEAYNDEGWGDEEIASHLKSTLLFQASSRCYGQLAADTYDGAFGDALPLTLSANFDVSVETIIMQHKDFPEAGKLMKAAVMLGSVSPVDDSMLVA